MEKTVIRTRFGDYTVYFPEGNGALQIYYGTNRNSNQLGDMVIGSLPRLPEGGSYENGELLISDGSPTALKIRQEASRHNFKTVLNYVVIRSVDGDLRVLPQTRSTEDGLTKRIRAAEKPNLKP